jgi:hypothetical protein
MRKSAITDDACRETPPPHEVCVTARTRAPARVAGPRGRLGAGAAGPQPGQTVAPGGAGDLAVAAGSRGDLAVAAGSRGDLAVAAGSRGDLAVAAGSRYYLRRCRAS